MSDGGKWENTLAGRWATAFGTACPEVRHNVTDADLTSAYLAETGGLTAERRAQLEAKAVADYHRDIPGRWISGTGAEILAQLRRANPDLPAGISYETSGGIAIMQDGEWRGDPAVVAAAEAGEAQKAAARQAQGEAWANGPTVLRTIAGPT